MTAGTHNIPLRTARDRIIDLLSIGNTYPLTDLNVITEQLKVAYGNTARIPIEHTQPNVLYELCDKAGDSLIPKIEVPGNGGTMNIETPAVIEDVTYRIRVTKTPINTGQGEHFLNELAPVKVGLDVDLPIQFKKDSSIELLDSTIVNPLPSDPRIIAYGTSASIEVDNTQEGVKYNLIIDGVDQGEKVAGNLGIITLTTDAMVDDVVIQVRATKTYIASLARPPEIETLVSSLYLKVKANPALAVSTAPVIDYQQATTLDISQAQNSIVYRAYYRTITNNEFVRGLVDANTVLTTGNPDVYVSKPLSWECQNNPVGFEALTAATGTGIDLSIEVNGLENDTLIYLQACKQHIVDVNLSETEQTTIESSICLDQAVVVLVGPDPNHSLVLKLLQDDSMTATGMQVSHGQAGVFYYFTPLKTGEEHPVPVYFHQLDAQDNTQNKGVDQLSVEVDFVIIADPVPPVPSDANLATTIPQAPRLDMMPIEDLDAFSVRAVKAQTGVETVMLDNKVVTAND